MKQPLVIHKIAALVVLLLWILAIAAMIWNWKFWQEGVYFILGASIATMFGTVALSRYLIRHRKTPSYGSIFLPPFACVFFLVFGGLFFEDGWAVFTLSYWTDVKGGPLDLIIPLAAMWFVCLLPAAAVVIYFQKPKVEHAPSASIPPSLSA